MIAALALSALLAPAPPASADSDPVSALDLAITSAESRLQAGDFPAAESRYREALFQGWLLKAAIADVEKRLGDARAALQNASLFVVDDRESLRSLAAARLRVGESAAAAETLTELVATDPRDAEARRLLAKALASDGKRDEALTQLDAASAAVADDPELTFELASEYLWLHRPESAARLFERVAKARPIAATQVLIGRAYRDASEPERARAALEQALRIDPQAHHAHYYLGMVILADAQSGGDRLERAIAEFREELRLVPDDPPSNDQLGLALLESERAQEALPALETAVRGQPRPLYLYHLGRCQLALERPAEAASASRRALELAEEQGGGEADVGKIHYQLGLALRKLGASQESAAQLAEAARLASADPATSGASADRERAADALSPLAQLPLWQRKGLTSRVSAALARAYFNLGVLQVQGQRPGTASERFTRAAAFLAKAAELDPDFPQVQSSLGVAYFNAREFAKATAPLERALAASPDDGLRRMLATSYLNTEAWDKAAALLRDDPGLKSDSSLRSAFALSLVKSGRGAEAEKILSAELAAEGESAELLALLGEAQAQQGKDVEAIRLLEQALRLDGTLGEAHRTLGASYLRQNRVSEAVAELELATRRSPEDPEAHEQLARAYEKAGKADLAKQQRDLARELKARRRGSAG